MTKQELEQHLSSHVDLKNTEDLALWIQKQTNNYMDQQMLSDIFSILIRLDLTAAAEIYLTIQDYTTDYSNEILGGLDVIGNTIFKPEITARLERPMTEQDRAGKRADEIFAFYAVNDPEDCIDFLKKLSSPSKYVAKTYDLMNKKKQKFKEKHFYKLSDFFMNAATSLDDYQGGRVIKTIECYVGDDNLAYYCERNYKLMRHMLYTYYHERRFSSFNAMLAFFVSDDGSLKEDIHIILGVSKDEFLDALLQGHTEKSVELYLMFCYKDTIPGIEEVDRLIKGSGPVAMYAVVIYILKNILRKQDMSDDDLAILEHLHNNQEFTDAYLNDSATYVDPDVNRSKLNSFFIDCFQLLCSKKRDVLRFVKCSDYYNAFQNDRVTREYNIIKIRSLNNHIDTADVKKEYSYLKEQYPSPQDLLYIVMNTYLKYYMDPFEYVSMCDGALDQYWFIGTESNKGRIRLISKSNNNLSNLRDIMIDEAQRRNENDGRNNYTEEKRFVRFKIDHVEPSTGTIIIKDKESLLMVLAEQESNIAIRLLLDGYIERADSCIRNFSIRDNMFHRDRFETKVMDDAETSEKLIAIYNENAGKYDNELQYLYLNTLIKYLVPIEKIYRVLDPEQYLLGNILISDNREYKQNSYYNIRLYYLSKLDKVVFRVEKDRIAPELVHYIDTQLYFLENAKTDKPVRISVYMNWNPDDFTKSTARAIYFHCVEKNIESLDIAVETYMNKIHNENRSGIQMQLLSKYIKEYGISFLYYKQDRLEQYHSFLETYLKCLFQDIQSILMNKRYMSRWMFTSARSNTGAYNKANMFVMLDDIFEREIFEDQDTKDCVSGMDITGKLFGLFRDKDMLTEYSIEGEMLTFLRIVYNKTIFKYIYGDYRDFEEAIGRTS